LFYYHEFLDEYDVEEGFVLKKQRSFDVKRRRKKTFVDWKCWN
jgi:hypothetical protein